MTNDYEVLCQKVIEGASDLALELFKEASRRRDTEHLEEAWRSHLAASSDLQNLHTRLRSLAEVGADLLDASYVLDFAQLELEIPGCAHGTYERLEECEVLQSNAEGDVLVIFSGDSGYDLSTCRVLSLHDYNRMCREAGHDEAKDLALEAAGDAEHLYHDLMQTFEESGMKAMKEQIAELSEA